MRYTTCPLGNEDWVLRASDIDISQRAGLGIGRGVRLDFKGVPILYTPFISFPVGNERKSGFLFPTLGTSSRSGYVAVGAVVLEHRAELRRHVPAHLVLQARRASSTREFRYLTDLGRGALECRVPARRPANSATRAACCTSSTSRISPSTLRLDIDAANVSDSALVRGFRPGPGRHERQLSESLGQPHRISTITGWRSLRAQNFQTIDDIGIADPELRPLHAAAAAGSARRASPTSLSA